MWGILSLASVCAARLESGSWFLPTRVGISRSAGTSPVSHALRRRSPHALPGEGPRSGGGRRCLLGRRPDTAAFELDVLGRRSFPDAVITHRAFAVNRTACRLSRFDLNRGSAIFGPLRVPFSDAKKLAYAASKSRKDCCSTTADASLSQPRSTVLFTSVMNCFDNSADFGNGSPEAKASRRTRRQSFHTTRAQPKARDTRRVVPASAPYKRRSEAARSRPYDHHRP
jgi:hypothetical protein